MNTERTIDTTIHACAHTITVRWWSIRELVTDEELMTSAEDRVRECIANDYSSGQLVYEDCDGASAIGWWEVAKS
jgi:hypothetical protein